MNAATTAHAELIQAARNGDAAAEGALRDFIQLAAERMPCPVLLSISEHLIQLRCDELRREAEAN